jgi:hypothetical protein
LPNFSFDEAWLHYYHDTLRRRYGVGAVVAVHDGAVIDWGDNVELVRAARRPHSASRFSSVRSQAIRTPRITLQSMRNLSAIKQRG